MNGVSFGEIHSYRDLKLKLAPFSPAPAQPQTNFLKVPGRDGYIDLTEANGEVKYNSREFTFTFYITPEDDMTFDERLTAVANALNGLRCKITLDRDPDYYWLGRCVVNKYTQDKNIGKIVVKATVDPYKLKQKESAHHFALNGVSVDSVIKNGRMAAVPTIECGTDGTIVVFNGKEYVLKAGKYKIPDIRFVEGDNPMTISGEGRLSFTWQEGAL